ncbi:DUF4150 domain-containing protein [Archangium sp.]|uniref:DUF4150 domain-containing protein n=1 Tax=Archangium sp. TaxID=1872627 RepID=UPI002D65DA4D|nr:DUF4150 domain-containing protein [Archangium sp.]HYO52642.1 DUF4150 domain-containing protein [Archangium sp.]
MGKEVYANGMELAHKSGDAKVMAAFPDVCLSPPPPPTGPVPVPYPNTSFAKDLQQGSKTVTIGGKPLALKGQSFYKTSPLGDEAATRNFGGSVLTHTITGKTYFQAHSMDVMVEGKNVCRHLDITTSNHASYPGSTPPMPNMEAMVQIALGHIAENKCPCCGGPKHADGKPMSRDEWYMDNIDKQVLDRQRQRGPNNPMSDQERKALAHDKKKRYWALLAKAKARPGCTCTKKTRVLPEPPCDVFYGRPPSRDPTDPKRSNPRRDAQQDAIEEAWNTYRPTYQKKVGIPSEPKVKRELTVKLGRPPSREEVNKERQINHLTPKSAGGCPTGDTSKFDNTNLQAHGQLCPACRDIDTAFGEFQT